MASQAGTRNWLALRAIGARGRRRNSIRKALHHDWGTNTIKIGMMDKNFRHHGFAARAHRERRASCIGQNNGIAMHIHPADHIGILPWQETRGIVVGWPVQDRVRRGIPHNCSGSERGRKGGAEQPGSQNDRGKPDFCRREIFVHFAALHIEFSCVTSRCVSSITHPHKQNVSASERPSSGRNQGPDQPALFAFQRACFTGPFAFQAHHGRLRGQIFASLTPCSSASFI